MYRWANSSHGGTLHQKLPVCIWTIGSMAHTKSRLLDVLTAKTARITRMAPNPLDTFWCLESCTTAPDPETIDHSDYKWSGPLVTTTESSDSLNVGDMLQPLSRTAKCATTKWIIRCPARASINSAAQVETCCQCPSIVLVIRQCCGLPACRAQFDTKDENADCREGHVLIQRQDNGGLC